MSSSVPDLLSVLDAPAPQAAAAPIQAPSRGLAGLSLANSPGMQNPGSKFPAPQTRIFQPTS